MSWLTTVDHKRIGMLYGGFAILFFLIGGLEALMIRTQLIVLADGEVTSGLPRREEGDSLILANAAGQEFTVSKKSIKERRDSANSLMPENFGELLSAADFNHLIGYLLRQAAEYFREHRVDAVVLIDYPGFNWCIARRAKRDASAAGSRSTRVTTSSLS